MNETNRIPVLFEVNYTDLAIGSPYFSVLGNGGFIELNQIENH